MIRRTFLPVVLIALSAGIYAESARLGIPDVIENERADAVPVWVSAEVAIAAEGTLRTDVIESAKAEELKRRLELRKEPRTGIEGVAAEAEECDTITSYSPAQYSSAGSASDLVQNSRYIFSASVANLRQGFYFGTPGTLIALDPEEWLKRETENVDERPLYVFFPQATIKTPRGTICARPWPRVPMPAIGDEVLIFAYSPPIGRDARVFELRPDKQMSFEGRSGAYVPEALRQVHRSSDLATIIDSIRHHSGIGELPARQKVW